ncbi:MAG: Gfo/Idh/MocA family oxidoreductase [Clostridia bacterium]|nr:Gfo/Idh/MocA family oxidoreductase [Clostridia bacterium]
MENANLKNFGLIGCGAIAKLHAKAICNIENARLVGVYDYSYEFAQRFASEHNCIAYKTLEELLECAEIDIVNICTPSGLHAEQIIKAANAKKHIIVEKPMAITKEQLDAAIESIDRNNVKVEVVSQLRFTPAIQKLKTAIESGAMGKILFADFKMKYYRSAEYYKKGGWRGTWKMDGGGALMNQGIHGIDLVQYLIGGVKSVYADCRTLAREIEVEDTANILVEYGNGAIGVIQCTTVAEPGYPRTIEVTGTKGTVIIKEDVIERWDLEESQEIECKTSLFNSGSDPMAFSEKFHEMQFMDLIEAINKNKQPLVDHNEGRKPVEIILASYKSSKIGKRVELL